MDESVSRPLRRVLLLLVALCALPFPAAAGPGSAGQQVTIAVVPGELSSLVYLALENGFFREQGIDVRLEDHEVDLLAVRALLHGRVDFATSTEFVLTRMILKGEELMILGTLCRADVYRIVTRRNRLSVPNDLHGKRIGIRQASIAEFYLSRFLLLSGIDPEEVQLLEIPLQQAGQALARGAVDAVFLMAGAIPELYEFVPRQELVSIPAQQGIDLHWLLSTHPGRKTSPETVEAVLRALISAEEFMAQQGREAHAILRKSLGLHEIDQRRYTFRVALEQPLILTMEDQARWLLKNQELPRKTVPNFLDSIHFNALESIRPEAVNIIH
jgi:ABC-type nitrate/sulfonate/bicarbonate transport system substrate-binding protein